MIQNLRSILFASIFLVIGITDCFAQIPAAPGAISSNNGGATVCQGATARNYSVAAVPLALTYTWTYTGTGASITSGATTRTIAVTYSASATSGSWSVTATNGSGTSGASPSFPVTVNITPARPAAFTLSSTNVCQTQTGVGYTVPAALNAISYNWTYTGTGATFSGSSRSETADFSFSATSGSVSVVSVNGSCTSIARTVGVTVSPIPATPGSISGVNPVCQGATGNAYSVSAVAGATSYNWSYTGTGATITAGSGTNAITVNYSSSASSGNWLCTAVNACGSSVAAASFMVSVNPTPNLSVASPQAATLGASFSLTAPSGATVYDWTGPNGYSVTNTQNPLVSSNMQITDAGTYTLTATNPGACFSTYNVLVNVQTGYMHRSVATGDFSDLATWESSTDGISWNTATVIPSISSTLVTITSGDHVTMDVAATIVDLVIEGTLTADPSNTLTINGDFTNNGTFVHSNGTIEFSGDNSTILAGSSTSDFYNLLINKTSDAALTVESVVSLKERLSFGTGATNELFIDNGNGGSFTFLSDASSSAHVDIFSSPLPILTGSFNCQHYFPDQPGRFTFLLGVPVTDTYISDLQPTQFDGSGLPIDGIYVSGPFTGTDSGNGLSVRASSSFEYNPNTGLYTSYPVSGGDVASSPLVIGKAYRESVRDGGPSFNYTTVVAKTLNVTGSLVTPGSFNFSDLVYVAGTKPFANSNIALITTGGWNLLANPYMSDISIELSESVFWTNSNVSNTSYVYNAATRDFESCASGVSGTNACIIPAFQGFWIQATGTGTPSLTIHEEAKVPGSNTAIIKRLAQESAIKNFLTIKLSSKSVSSINNTVIRYVNGASMGNDSYDGFKIGAANRSCLSGVNVCLYTKAIDEVYYSVNAKPYGILSDTTQLNVIAPDGITALDFSDISNLEPKYQITLIDNYTNANVNVSANPVYNFVVTNSDTNTWGPRFRVVFTDISNVTTGVDQDKSLNGDYANVYPSPGAADKISVYLNNADTDAEFSVYDLTGRQVFHSKLHVIDKKAFQVFDLSRILQSGIYSTIVKSSSASYSQKLIIR